MIVQIINNMLTFCQKHLNHHCVHSHNCNKPQHKSKSKSKETVHQHNKSANNNKSYKQINSVCNFTGGYSSKNGNCTHEDILRQLGEKDQLLHDLQQKMSIAQDKYSKLFHQNGHLYTQIQYYREQFASLIENNTTDARNQIRRRLKQTTDMTLRIKSLQAQNMRLSNQNQGFRKFIHDDKMNRQHNKNINTDLEDKYNSIYHKLKIVERQRQDLRVELQKKLKDQNRKDEQYIILKKQFNFQCQKYKKEMNSLNRQLDGCQKQLHKLRNTSQKDRQMLTIDRDNYEKKEIVLRDKVNQFQLRNKELTDTIKELTAKCEELTEDLFHAKAILDKKHQNSQQYQDLKKEMNQHVVETKTVIKQRNYQVNKENRQNAGHQDEDNEKLRLEITSLKQQISLLESKNTAHFEEIIMNIGASQAFRRLLDEKNTTIKKLMRQKGELYAKIFNSQI